MDVRQKVLVIEPDPAYAKTLRETLTIEGFDVLLYDHVPDDLAEQVVREKPDIVSLDAALPDNDGFRIAARLKADIRIQHIPIVFVSSLGQPAEIQSGRDSGAADYIVKAKTTLRDIANRIRTVLGQPPTVTAPKIHITQLPTVPTVTSTPRRTSFIPNRRLFWVAGLVLVIIAGVRLSSVFSHSFSNSSEGIPIAYLEPTACVVDDDCRIQPDCCSQTTVNLYHVKEQKNRLCPAVECSSYILSTKCVDRQCAAVLAKQETADYIVYALVQPTIREQRVESLDCLQRGGGYRACGAPCSDDDKTCDIPTCSSECMKPHTTLPIPSSR